MPSPFPGMNPYLEQRDLWRGFHGLFIGQLTFALTPLVGPRYYVEFEESLYVEQPDGTDGPVFAVADAAATLPDPVRRRHRWLTIRDSKSREVVTVIEVLSPSNKAGGEDRGRYLVKRGEVLRSTAHLLEIDLLRGGQRMPLDGMPSCDYCVVLSRRAERPLVGVWPINLRDPLPAVPVPLREGEAEPVLPLKPVLDAVYGGAGYGRRIYADGEPDPPLSAADAAWAAGLVPAG